MANDVGVEAMFTRQVIAYGRPGDALLAFSTSGGSANVIAALAEARRAGLVTIAFVGYDGGRIAAERLADHVVVTRSEHIPRIQEAQASAWHVLRELVEEEAMTERPVAGPPRRRARSGGPLREVLFASLRGVVAAMAMTGMRAFTVSVGLVDGAAAARDRATEVARALPARAAQEAPRRRSS